MCSFCFVLFVFLYLLFVCVSLVCKCVHACVRACVCVRGHSRSRALACAHALLAVRACVGRTICLPAITLK